MASLKHFDWKTNDEHVYIRNLHGWEFVFALLANTTNNMTSPLIGVRFTGLDNITIPDDVLYRLVRAAWIKARFDLPQVALHTIVVPDGTEFDCTTSQLVYEAGPKTVVDAWADRTIFMHNFPADHAVESIEHAAFSKDWPNPAKGHDVQHLHISRDSGTTFLCLHSAHYAWDVKGSYLLIDHLLKELTQLVGMLDSPEVLRPSDVYPWGEEYKRLSLPMAVAAGYANADGSPFPGEQEILQAIGQQMAALQPIHVLPVQAQSDSNAEQPVPTVHAVHLTASETSAYRAAAKAHRLTVTELFSAIAALAEYRLGLRLDSKKVDSRPGAIATSKSLMHFCSWDHRNSLPIPADAPFNAAATIIGATLPYSLEMLGNVQRELPEILPAKDYLLPEIFWSQAAAAGGNVLQQLKSTRREAMISVHPFMKMMLDSEMFRGPKNTMRGPVIVSSVGNMDAIIQETYSSSSSNINVNLHVNDTITRASMPNPSLWCCIVTFRGQLRVECLTNNSYFEPTDVEVFRLDIERFMHAVIASHT